jgi:hypothetical protein
MYISKQDIKFMILGAFMLGVTFVELINQLY